MTDQEEIIQKIFIIAQRKNKNIPLQEIKKAVEGYERLINMISLDFPDKKYTWQLPNLLNISTIKNVESKHVRDKTRKRLKINAIFKQTFNNVWKELA